LKTDKSAALAVARSLIGAKWRHLCRKPWAIDCIGIIVVSLRAGGIEMRDRTDYGREPWRDGLEDDLRLHFGDPLPVAERQSGDIVLMKDELQPAPGHVGIITELDSVIHSYSQTGVVEHGIDAVWLRRMVCVYRPDWSDAQCH
jgi:cell wall-associated NlpC family hydrolase